MKLALAQINPIVGDLEGNADKIIDFLNRAKGMGCDLVIFPELSLTGYPPEDLLLRKDFITKCNDALEHVKRHTGGIGVLLGAVLTADDTGIFYNSAVLIDDGQIIGSASKCVLAKYSAFDESRYFEPSPAVRCLEYRGIKLGVAIGEDVYAGEKLFLDNKHDRNVLDELGLYSPDLYINISAVPYQYGTLNQHLLMLGSLACRYGKPLVHVNQVGGNGELIFAGSSCAFEGSGSLVLFAESFTEDLVVYDTDHDQQPLVLPNEDISWVYDALVLGYRDYALKAGFTKTLLGLSGGIDSALVACLAVEALGRENVLAIYMPSRYSTAHSREDARVLAENLGIEYRVLPIEDIFAAYIRLLNGSDKTLGDLAEENIQARIRGNLWMFVSNREGWLAVTASNKSEAAVGYSTLYGDMCGGLSVIGDIPKTMVYKLCEYINRDKAIIPPGILTKPPSAELRPGQVDEDSLPPYDLLDAVIQMYFEDNLSVDEIVARGYERNIVVQILNRIDRFEFKRHQAPPVLKITSNPWGRGRKIPLVHKYRWDQIRVN